jgi:lipid II:glycine glycyltransferase (peptidoglycan interpeptide bridge formation enzyme)
MDKFELKDITDKKVWEKFVLLSNPKSFLQSWNWGETNKIAGEKIFRLGFYKNKILKGVCLLIFQKAKRGPHLLIPGGPILDWNNDELVSFFLKSVKNLARKEKAWFIRMRPELYDTNENLLKVSKLGFISAPMHLHAENTWVLNVTKTENELLAQMRKGTRYLIKKSQNIGLQFVESKNPNDTKILRDLQVETAKRHGFIGFPEKLFSAQLETFAKDSQGALYLGKLNGKVLSAGIFIFYGDTCYYHHSASSKESLQIPVQYFMQWQIVKKCKELGISHYNFWGIAPNNDPKHRFYGVTLFKTGFGGERIDWLHARDLPLTPLYYLTYLFETVRKIYRKL